MIRKNQKLINGVHALTDACLIFLAYLAAMYMRFEVLNGRRGVDLMDAPYLILIAVYSAAIVLVYYVLRLYGPRRFSAPGSESLTILAVNGVGALGLMAVMYLIRQMDFPRLAVVLFWGFSSLFVIAKRTVGRALLRHYRKLGYNQKHVIVVGSGHLARQYVSDLRSEPDLGYTVDGYVGKDGHSDLGTCLGRYEELEMVLEQHAADELVAALDADEFQFMKQVIQVADKEGVRLTMIPFYNDYLPTHPTIDVVGSTKLINMRATPLDHLGWAMVKRGMDIVGSLLLILLTSPIMLAVAVGVKLSSPGPILFKQERIGLNKKPFMMLKFRSMRVTGTETTGWSTDTDPRKTKFGSFIRKCSLDELPQFFNVLAGQMSLIGPRPEVPFHVNHFKDEIPLYLVRQQVRPGITGWAQVNGLRGDTSIAERVKYDIWYIENWSLGLDIKILFKTVFGGMINSEKLAGTQEPKREGK